MGKSVAQQRQTFFFTAMLSIIAATGLIDK
jgi:hypothetical protein